MILTLLLVLMIIDPITIFDSSLLSSDSQWYIVDDRVMGGRSQGAISIDTNGCALFAGYVTTENNGGFSSLRYSVTDFELNGQKTFKLLIKGDGKEYQFRVKAARNEYHSYVYDFSTSGEWETIEISIDKLIPTFRGRELKLADYTGKEISEIGFLIGNKKKEEFSLIIKKVVFY